MKSGQHPPAEPWRDDDATKLCPVCQHRMSVVGRGQYCSDSCRKKAWRRRHQTFAVPVVVPAPGLSRRSLTVYACQACDTRALGVQRCEDCGAFMTRVGLGGECPCCCEPVAVCELLDDATAVSWQPARSPATAAPAASASVCQKSVEIANSHRKIRTLPPAGPVCPPARGGRR
jgi:hypothetical protein